MMWFVITSSLSSVFWVDLQQARRSLEVRAPRGNLAVPPSLVWAFQCGPPPRLCRLPQPQGPCSPVRKGVSARFLNDFAEIVFKPFKGTDKLTIFAPKCGNVVRLSTSKHAPSGRLRRHIGR